MKEWHGFSRVAGCALALMLPSWASAAGLDDDVSIAHRTVNTVDRLEPIVAAESVLVGNGGNTETPTDHALGLPSRFAEDSVVETAPAEFMEYPRCSGVACDACPVFPSCTDTDDLGGVGAVAFGWLNRRLGHADPRWIVQVDALMLWQGNIASRPLFVDSGTGLTALDVNQAQTVVSAGPRYGIFFNVDECRAIEGNYFSVGSFAGTEPLPAGTYTAVNMPTSFAPPTTDSVLQTSGRIQTAELNWRGRRCGSPATFLAGFRWVEWNQNLSLVDAATPSLASIDSRVGNDLYGGQMGIDLSLWDNQNGPIRVNGIGKAGVFANNAFQRTSETVQGGIVRGPESAAVTTTSFFGEVGVNGSVRLRRWLAWRTGYSLFWLSGVAVPANQLSLVSLSTPPPPAGINTTGSVFLHGVTTGLEARW